MTTNKQDHHAVDSDTSLEDLLQKLAEDDAPQFIEKDGAPHAVVQNIHAYEQDQESLALFQIIEHGERQAQNGQVQSMDTVFSRIRKKAAARE